MRRVFNIVLALGVAVALGLSLYAALREPAAVPKPLMPQAATGTLTAGKIVVAGGAAAGGCTLDTDGSLTCDGKVTAANDLEVTGTITGSGDFDLGDILRDSHSSVVTITTNLDVQGNENGDLATPGNGTVDIGPGYYSGVGGCSIFGLGDLGCSRDVAISRTLTVISDTMLHGNVIITGNVAINGTASGENAFSVNGTASGESSAVGGGSNNIASGEASVVGGGATNNASASGATISGGGLNIASSENATISGGEGNTASGNNATIPGGKHAAADSYGEYAYASGAFDTAGDAQTGLFVIRTALTTHVSGTWNSLYLDGASELMTVLTDTAWTVTADIVGLTAGAAQMWNYTVVCGIVNDGGTTAIQGNSVTAIYEADADYNAQCAADDTNDALLIQVRRTDETDYDVQWVATVRATQVTYPSVE